MMLKLTNEQTSGQVTIRLEGKLSGSWVEEFDRVWRSLGPWPGPNTLSIDLRDLTFADRAGRTLLAAIYRQTGAEFIANTPLTKYIAEEAMGKTPDGNQGG
jgi:hypothetical protein